MKAFRIRSARTAAIYLLALTLGFVVLASSLALAKPVPGKKPNVVLIMVDDVGYGDLACHGNPLVKTPNLDKLHSKSVRFTDFHVSSLCAPTRATLLTGRHCRHVAVRGTNWTDNLLTADVPTLANLFDANGYSTGIFGKWHLGEHYPYRPQDRGFQEVVVHGNGAVTTVGDVWGNDYFDDTYWHNGKKQKYAGYCTDVWFDLAMGFIDQRKDRPFFLYLPTNAAHSPYIAPESDREPYEGKAKVPGFLGMITNIDTNVGRLMKYLDENNLIENTIMIFMSDNGTAAGADVYTAGMRGRKGSHYDGGHRVPFFIRWPAGGIGGGKDVTQLSAHLDVWPTLADLCGLEQGDSKLDGMSLSPFLTGDMSDAKPRTLVDSYNAVAMTERWRLVNGKELYDIKADPSQRKDIAARNPQAVAQLAKVLAANAKGADAIQRRFVVGSPKQNPVEFTPDQSRVRRMRSGHFGREIHAGTGEDTIFPIDVEQDGIYHIELRRWPEETGGAIRGKLSPKDTALDIVSASLQVQNFDRSMKVDDSTKAVTFEVPLEAGEAEIVARFVTVKGDGPGVYYVKVARQEVTRP